MAQSQPDPELAQAAQEHLAQQAALAVGAAWHLLDPHALKASSQRFTAAVHASVQALGQASAAGMAQHFKAERAAEIVGLAPRIVMPAPITAQDVSRALSWSISSMYGRTTPETLKAAQDAAGRAAGNLVVHHGRSTYLSAVEGDRKARGWARIAEPECCAFCAMLATRGPVYNSKDSADFPAHKDRHTGIPNCRCHPQAVFGTWRPSARTKELQQLWSESTSGLSGNEARIAFRQALEGRARTEHSVTLARTPRGASDVAKAIAALEKSVATMKRNNSGGQLDKTIVATQARIDELRAQAA